MEANYKSILVSANAAFRKGEYEKAVMLYDQALNDADDETLKEHIRFNQDLAAKKLNVKTTISSISQLSSEPPVIPVINFDDTEERYIDYAKKNPIDPRVKLIAFYLPQFHPFPENDKWWGKGFTEWSNVGKALPNYIGHYQPHCPIHFGYYDLRIPSVTEEQAALAKEYGLYGFSYYYYWFAGKTLLETPLLKMLDNKKVDIPFCLTWANENWTRRWDGQENDILIAQDHSLEDSLAFIKNIIKYFKDPRYIRVNNKPLLIIYRPNIIPEIEAIATSWRDEIKSQGFEGLYLVAAQTFGIKSPEPFGFDASVEFPPHTVKSTDIRHQLNLSNEKFSGHIFSYQQAADNSIQYKEPDYKAFRTAMLSWDNTARKQDGSHVFHGFTLLKYKQWLSSLCCNVNSNKKYNEDEKLVFINAWNEWAEGTHLEPDRKYGYAYLQSTYDVVKSFDKPKIACLETQTLTQRSAVAVILHMHYMDLWSHVESYLDNFGSIAFDLYITTTNSEIINLIKDAYPDSYVILVENRGRDILPFIETLRTIHDFKYDAICKIHTKRSEYRKDGKKIRDELFNSLLGSKDIINSIVSHFMCEPSLGLAVPERYLISHTDHNMTFDTEIVDSLASILNVKFQFSSFPAGSMYWFRQSALSRLLLLDGTFFAPEEGLADGTTAHGVERLICTAAEEIGYKVIVI